MCLAFQRSPPTSVRGSGDVPSNRQRRGKKETPEVRATFSHIFSCAAEPLCPLCLNSAPLGSPCVPAPGSALLGFEAQDLEEGRL